MCPHNAWVIPLTSSEGLQLSGILWSQRPERQLPVLSADSSWFKLKGIAFGCIDYELTPLTRASFQWVCLLCSPSRLMSNSFCLQGS